MYPLATSMTATMTMLASSIGLRRGQERRGQNDDEDNNDNDNEREYDEKLQNMHVRRVEVDAVRATRVYLQRRDGVRPQGTKTLFFVTVPTVLIFFSLSFSCCLC